MSKNIEMNYKTDSGYEVLYPQTITNNISDFSSSVLSLLGNYYTKQQIDDINSQYVKTGEISNNNPKMSISSSNYIIISNINMNAHIIIWLGIASTSQVSEQFGGFVFVNYNVACAGMRDSVSFVTVTWGNGQVNIPYQNIRSFYLTNYKVFQIF